MPRSTQAGLAKSPGSSRRVSDPPGRSQSRLMCDLGRLLQKLYGDSGCRGKRAPGGYRPQCEQLESRQLLSSLPVNEPLTTARFSGLYGHWYPHGRDDITFVRTFLTQCRAVALSMQTIRRVNPAAQLVQTAAAAGLDLRPLHGRHDEAVAATLPLARGLG